MTTRPSTIDGARWEELTRTAALVRAGADATVASRRSWRRIATSAAYLVVLGGVTIAALHAAGDATPVRADGAADGALFSLTNQDRASNGVRSLGGNGTLGGIGEGSRYNGCGFPVNGRSVDMIQRNYFAHPILNCGGRLVFSMMQAFGVRYQSAGENIGWNTYGDAGTAASQINSAFMNSPDHRSNILNGNFTALGIGSANSGSAAWSGGGGSYTGAWMFSEEFAQLAGSPPPPPTATTTQAEAEAGSRPDAEHRGSAAAGAACRDRRPGASGHARADGHARAIANGAANAHTASQPDAATAPDLSRWPAFQLRRVRAGELPHQLMSHQPPQATRAARLRRTSCNAEDHTK